MQWPASMSASCPMDVRATSSHLYARPLYAAIGEEDNRNRRPAEWDARAILGDGGGKGCAPA